MQCFFKSVITYSKCRFVIWPARLNPWYFPKVKPWPTWPVQTRILCSHSSFTDVQERPSQPTIKMSCQCINTTSSNCTYNPLLSNVLSKRCKSGTLVKYKTVKYGGLRTCYIRFFRRAQRNAYQNWISCCCLYWTQSFCVIRLNITIKCTHRLQSTLKKRQEPISYWNNA